MVRLLAARNQPLYDSLIEFRLAPKALSETSPPRDGFAVANLGHRPRNSSRHETSAESAIQLTGRFELLPKVNRALSAGAFGFRRSLGRCPRL